MTKEELEEKFMRLMTRFVRDAGYSTRQAISDMESLLSSQKSREIPPPPLKWVDQEDHISARMFDKLRFSVYARYGGKFEALYMGYPIDHLEHPFQSDAIKACEAKWKEIWEKEMSH